MPLSLSHTHAHARIPLSLTHTHTHARISLTHTHKLIHANLSLTLTQTHERCMVYGGVWCVAVCCSVFRMVWRGVYTMHQSLSLAECTLCRTPPYTTLCVWCDRDCVTWSLHHTPLSVALHHTPLSVYGGVYVWWSVWWSVCMVESTPYTSLCHTIHESLSHHPLVSVTRSHQPFCASEPTARLSCDTIHSKIQWVIVTRESRRWFIETLLDTMIERTHTIHLKIQWVIPPTPYTPRFNEW